MTDEIDLGESIVVEPDLTELYETIEQIALEQNSASNGEQGG
jgi:hypothetical protein